MLSTLEISKSDIKSYANKSNPLKSIMDFEKLGLVVVIVLAGFTLFVAGTSGLSGNIANDLAFYTNPVAGLAFLVIFVMAVFLVLRSLTPETED